jgi:hypothetical protein
VLCPSRRQLADPLKDRTYDEHATDAALMPPLRLFDREN